MAELDHIRDLNRELARKINEEARNNPASAYANRFVGIADGRVVVVADSFDEMIRRLRSVEPDQRRTFGVEASRDYGILEEVCEIG